MNVGQERRPGVPPGTDGHHRQPGGTAGTGTGTGTGSGTGQWHRSVTSRTGGQERHAVLTAGPDGWDWQPIPTAGNGSQNCPPGPSGSQVREQALTAWSGGED